MVSAGIIEPGFGLWVSETLLSRKPNSKFRVVHDYRVPNSGTIDSGYLCHNVEQSLDTLGIGCPKVFSQTDASNRFWAIRIAEPH